MGRWRNELRNAAGLAQKLRIFIAVQDLIISFYVQKFSLFKCPPLSASAPSLRLLWRRYWEKTLQFPAKTFFFGVHSISATELRNLHKSTFACQMRLVKAAKASSMQNFTI